MIARSAATRSQEEQRCLEGFYRSTKFNISPAELAEGFAPLAEPIAKVPGLRWKIWSLNGAESEFAGIYLFDDAESAQAYLGGPIIAQVSAHPALSDISAKQDDLNALGVRN